MFHSYVGLLEGIAIAIDPGFSYRMGPRRYKLVKKPLIRQLSYLGGPILYHFSTKLWSSIGSAHRSAPTVQWAARHLTPMRLLAGKWES